MNLQGLFPQICNLTNSIAIDLSIIFFQTCKKNYNASFIHLQKKVILHRSKICVSSNKESENNPLNGHCSCHWCFYYCIPFLFALSLQTAFFKLITYCLSSSAFIFLTFIFFYRQLRSGLRPQNCLYFQGFRGSKLFNGCLVV